MITEGTILRAGAARTKSRAADEETEPRAGAKRARAVAGGFDPALHRELMWMRIGWVAAEISRHGGLAVCSPIAPFDATRTQVRQMVADAGGAFFLVHVATPLEECERRDRKGLYAKARRGELKNFTGIDSPYEVPLQAEVHLQTVGTSPQALVDELAKVVAEEAA